MFNIFLIEETGDRVLVRENINAELTRALVNEGNNGAKVRGLTHSYESVSVVAATWPQSPGWYWAFGRIAGMREATLMAARALVEGDRLVVYVGEAMTHRLSFPDPELPLQFKPATLPEF